MLRNTPSILKRTLLSASLLLTLSASLTAGAATWTPMTSGGRGHAVDVSQSGTFPIPPVIAARGGVLHITLVGGGEGGHASHSGCDDYAVQGGKGGDGGEVIEMDVAVKPGQCTAGIGVSIGAGGRGGYRAGNGAALGEPGGQTTATCSGTVLATALGGGRRADTYTASRSAKGGAGGVVMNTMDSSTQAISTRATEITAAAEGQMGRGGYGSGGGGGGAGLALAGSAVRADGTVVQRSTIRNAPMGKAGYGAGAGAGPAEYASDANVYPAENAAQYGAGGGGGAGMCTAATTGRDGGNAYSGLARFQWNE